MEEREIIHKNLVQIRGVRNCSLFFSSFVGALWWPDILKFTVGFNCSYG